MRVYINAQYIYFQYDYLLQTYDKDDFGVLRFKVCRLHIDWLFSVLVM